MTFLNLYIDLTVLVLVSCRNWSIVIEWVAHCRSIDGRTKPTRMCPDNRETCSRNDTMNITTMLVDMSCYLRVTDAIND